MAHPMQEIVGGSGAGAGQMPYPPGIIGETGAGAGQMPYPPGIIGESGAAAGQMPYPPGIIGESGAGAGQMAYPPPSGNEIIGRSGAHQDLAVHIKVAPDDQPSREAGTQTNIEAGTQTDDGKIEKKKSSVKLDKKDVREAASCFRQVFKICWDLCQDDDE